MKLSGEQVATYLLKYKRSAESLLSAFDETHDKAMLKEAAEKFPNDPRVQLAVLTQDALDKALTPEARKLWLDRLKESSPDNGLPNALAAMDDLNNGRTQEALAEIKSANEKAGMSAFYAERLQSLEEMYLVAGLSPQEAKAQATHNMLLPLEAKMKGIATQLAELQKNYLTSGNPAAAAEMAALGVNLGKRWGDPNSSLFLINELVGIAMQRVVLQNLDPNTYYEFLGKTAGEGLADLKKQQEGVKTISTGMGKLFPQMSDGDKMIFMDRMKLYGDRNAWSWVQQTYGTNQ
ncbi:MAG: hypothetical protein JWM68_2330 [Verrucomicrobiales bacterium]|nr:hypothetical protein [Verrucomicrobiales bacterium]